MLLATGGALLDQPSPMAVGNAVAAARTTEALGPALANKQAPLAVLMALGGLAGAGMVMA